METLSFWESFAISTFATVLRAIVKNPSKYAAIKNQLQEISGDIQAAFPAGQ
ncbi:MAG TPA: hypothetical protein VFB79_07640 [Candidatus Angelobacter sp.]|nr:hypothetical protein [Candidatus Angelobacter sp.]